MSPSVTEKSRIVLRRHLARTAVRTYCGKPVRHMPCVPPAEVTCPRCKLLAGLLPPPPDWKALAAEAVGLLQEHAQHPGAIPGCPICAFLAKAKAAGLRSDS